MLNRACDMNSDFHKAQQDNGLTDSTVNRHLTVIQPSSIPTVNRHHPPIRSIGGGGDGTGFDGNETSQDLEASAAHLLELTAELQAIAEQLRGEARHLQDRARESNP